MEVMKRIDQIKCEDLQNHMHSNEAQIHSVMSESRFQISKTEKYHAIVYFKLACYLYKLCINIC